MKRKRAGKPAGMTLSDVLAAKRALWLAVCSIADAYGFGAKRMERFFEAMHKNTEELERMREIDEDYAYEKLRQKAERVTGIQIKYLYEHEQEQEVII